MILIVEDDKSTCEVIAYILTELGFPSECAETVEIAIEKAKRLTPTIVIADLLLANGDAIPFINYCQSEMPKVKIILMSAIAKRSLETIAHGLRLDSYLSKPFEVETLENMLQGMA